jgi:hypothetical protein
MATKKHNILTPRVRSAQYELLTALAESVQQAGFERDVAQGKLSAVISEIWNEVEILIKAIAGQGGKASPQQPATATRKPNPRRNAAYDSLISEMVRRFNQAEQQREYQAAHTSTETPTPQQKQAEKRRFYSTVPIVGYFYWFMISGLPVQLSPYTEMGTSQTGRVIARL